MKYIFEITIKPGHTEEEYVAAWQKGSAIIQQQAGAQGTALHRKIGEPGKLLAIATWESKDARDKAMQALKQLDEKSRRTIDQHKQYGEFRAIGNFEEPEWKVFR